MITIRNSFLFAITLSAYVLASTSSVNKKVILKVNFGGGPIGDFLGEEQVMDMEGFAKTQSKDQIQNTDQQELFQTQRFARSEDMTVRIPVPDGIYSVTLLFAEGYGPVCAPGARVFDISLGTPVSGVTKVIDSFDVFQAAGCKSAYGKKFERVPSKDGIVVHLTQKSQHPFMNGFIVEGFPLVKGDGKAFRTVGRVEDSNVESESEQNPMQQQVAMQSNEMDGLSARTTDPTVGSMVMNQQRSSFLISPNGPSMNQQPQFAPRY